MAVADDKTVAKSWRLGPLKISGGFREIPVEKPGRQEQPDENGENRLLRPLGLGDRSRDL